MKTPGEDGIYKLRRAAQSHSFLRKDQTCPHPGLGGLASGAVKDPFVWRKLPVRGFVPAAGANDHRAGPASSGKCGVMVPSSQSC